VPCQSSASLSCAESPPSSLRILGGIKGAAQVHARSTIVAASPFIADEQPPCLLLESLVELEVPRKCMLDWSSWLHLFLSLMSILIDFDVGCPSLVRVVEGAAGGRGQQALGCEHINPATEPYVANKEAHLGGISGHTAISWQFQGSSAPE